MLRGDRRRSGLGCPASVREQPLKLMPAAFNADIQDMRLSRLLVVSFVGALVLAAGASAATPRFAVFDVHHDLAHASHNVYGDVKIWKRRSALASRARGATLVHCGSDCTFGSGWLAFSTAPGLSAGSVSAARTHRTKVGWSVVVTLSAHGRTSWAAFDRRATLSSASRGVPDALVLVLDGDVVGQPLANQVSGRQTLEIPGLSRANALRTAKLLNR